MMSSDTVNDGLTTLRGETDAFRREMDALRQEMRALSNSVVDWRTLPSVVALFALHRENQARRRS